MAPETGASRLRPGGPEGGWPPAQRQLLGHEVCSASKTFLNIEMCTRAKTTWMQPVSYWDTDQLLSLDTSYPCQAGEQRLVGPRGSWNLKSLPLSTLPLKHLWLTTNSLDIFPHRKYPQQTQIELASKAILAEIQKKEKAVDTSKSEMTITC